MRKFQNKKFLIGLSGGPDSVYLLNKIKNKIPKNNLIACHVNYNYREDSSVDKNICIKICEKYNIKLFVKEVLVDYKRLSVNFEAWAREVRYEYFCELVSQQLADVILIAHNQNDDVETFLMQLQKNSLPNHYGIEKLSYYKSTPIYRPILNIKKSRIMKYLIKNKIAYAIDSTNENSMFTRNKVRKSLMENDFRRLLKEKKNKNKQLKIWDKKIRKTLEKGFLSVKDLSNVFEYNQRLVFEYFKSKDVGSLLFTRKKATLKELIKQLLSNKTFLKISLGGYSLIKDYNLIYLLKDNEWQTITLKNNNAQSDMSYFSNIKEIKTILDKHKIGENLIITNDWKTFKDKVFYKNKKLSKYYKDNKISYLKRNRVGLVIKDNMLLLNEKL
ncbi:tRNA lysidine(34) synthetase TilS [Spiroplasma apis]|uniref:tRNA(Ile)-lysidine synthase n=1 Tax=Spiroplasma apis B31 TaxID=1276258 RepID=V5RJ81_SPIAP|nr:tRNA lysidine(34) synthetase TilS [Spiroplasma apis]AHB35860.1 tRNA(Ile)-lysidine synthase [Spiroplasma apis B31]